MNKDKLITQEKLRELLYYNPETGIFRWKNTPSRKVHANDIAGTIRPDDYVQIGIGKRYYLAHRIAWLYVHGYLPENDVDHINRNPSDNRIVNLREVSQQCNSRNTDNRKNNTFIF